MVPGFLFGMLIGSAVGKNNRRQQKLIGREVALSRVSRRDPYAGQKVLEFYKLWDKISFIVFDFVVLWIAIPSIVLSMVLVGVCCAGLIPTLPFYPLYEGSYIFATVPLMIAFWPLVYPLAKVICKTKKQGLLNELKELIKSNDQWIWETINRFDPYSMRSIDLELSNSK